MAKKAFLPPRWFVRLAWRTHRALYKITGGRRGLGESLQDIKISQITLKIFLKGNFLTTTA